MTRQWMKWVRGRWLGQSQAALTEVHESLPTTQANAIQNTTATTEEIVYMVDHYHPNQVGNDASARPWESSVLRDFEEELALAHGNWPDDFDVAQFLDKSKKNFVMLQAAWDRADVAWLKSMLTEEMLVQIQSQLNEREKTTTHNRTEVFRLDAQLLGIELVGGVHVVSVEFSGLIGEHPQAGPSPFREIWRIQRSQHEQQTWLVSGVQALLI